MVALNDDDDKVTAVSRRGTKINSSDPPLPAVLASYPAEPLLTLFDPPIELATFRPHGVSTWIGGSTSRRSASARRCSSASLIVGDSAEGYRHKGYAIPPAKS